MTTGSLTLNGVTDEEVIKILEAKKQQEEVFSFNPQQLQPVTRNANGKQLKEYNSAILSWSSERGIQSVIELLRRLSERQSG